ncbi:YqxA family protein [Bacillus sp. CGMCC 1.16607]|uniref:YqxA family protein n=1 Tax=Bacillus sp. CGMCC 1.16607 TaxID=3351842 RepID=UPI0036426742
MITLKLFLFKSLLIASLMFLSVLFGMQQANIGIQKMKGYEDPKFKSALSLQTTESGELHASVLGNDVTSHDIESKKQKLEELKAYNFFSDLGKKISTIISGGLRALMEK